LGFALYLSQKIIERVRKAIGAALQLAFSFSEAVLLELWRRAKITRQFGRDPMECEQCGEEMILWKAWTPKRGVMYYPSGDAPGWVEVEASLKEVFDPQLNFSF
jgi:hypothetical protein